MKNTNVVLLTGLLIYAYVIYKAFTEHDEAMAEFFAAIAIFLVLIALKHLQRA